jgi:hypothetical protein
MTDEQRERWKQWYAGQTRLYRIRTRKWTSGDRDPDFQRWADRQPCPPDLEAETGRPSLDDLREDQHRAWKAECARPCYAVSAAGKDRWFWCIWASHNALHDLARALAHGHAASREAAIQAALAAAPDGSTPNALPAGMTRVELRRLAAERRARRTAKETDAASVEYVYEHHIYYPECLYDPEDPTSGPHWVTSRFRILRKTRTSYFVVPRDDGTGYFQDGELLVADESIRLDRRRLEAGEEVWHRGSHRHYTLNPNPPEREPDRSCPPHLQGPLGVLGLNWPCTAKDVKAAYRRLARKRHPDSGGTHEDFLALRTAYETALRSLGARC